MSRYQPVSPLGHLDNQTAAISGAGYWRGVRLANVGHRCFFAGAAYLGAAAITAVCLALVEWLVPYAADTAFLDLAGWVAFVVAAAMAKVEFDDDLGPWMTVRPLLDPKTGGKHSAVSALLMPGSRLRRGRSVDVDRGYGHRRGHRRPWCCD